MRTRKADAQLAEIRRSINDRIARIEHDLETLRSALEQALTFRAMLDKHDPQPDLTEPKPKRTRAPKRGMPTDAT